MRRGGSSLSSSVPEGAGTHVEGAALDRPTRTTLWTLAKVAFVATCIFFVVGRVDLGALPSDVASLDGQSWGLLAALVPLHVVALGLRWRVALGELGEKVPLRAVLGDLMVGVTYNSLLPSTVGGDLVRAYRCATRVRHESSALASIALERVIGLLCLAALPLVGVLAGLAEAPRTLLLVSLGATAAFAAALAGLHLPIELAARLVPVSLPRVAALARETAGALRRTGPGARARIAAWSLAYQALVAVSFLVVARALSTPQTLRAVLIGVPIALVLSSIPLSIGGFGVREGAFVAVLGPLGVAPAHALVMSLFWALEWLVVGIAGGLIIIVTRLAPRGWPTGEPSP
jgi:uncharacterized membrane protein YbhN (UPF0104 family)